MNISVDLFQQKVTETKHITRKLSKQSMCQALGMQEISLQMVFALQLVEASSGLKPAALPWMPL